MMTGGVSLLGSYHRENQDAYWCRASGDYCALAVSDGLGSKPRSAAGSRAFCACVEELYEAGELPEDLGELAGTLHGRWLAGLGDIPAEDCCATALFAFAGGGALIMGALGDGCLAAQTDGGRVTVLLDGKAGRFSNETDCLREIHDPAAWRMIRVSYETLEGILAMTDGIEVYPNDEETLARFAGELFRAYRGMEAGAVIGDTARWLAEWPGADDKTIAFCIQGEGEGEDGSL